MMIIMEEGTTSSDKKESIKSDTMNESADYDHRHDGLGTKKK